MHNRLAAVFVLGLIGFSAYGCGSSNSDTESNFDAAGGNDGNGKGHSTDATTLGSPDGNGKGGGTTKLNGTDGSTSTCKKKTCADLKATCGKQSDSCNGILDCGHCTAPESCGGGGTPNQCGVGSTDAGDDGGIPTGTMTIAPLNKTITIPYGSAATTVTYTAQVGGKDVSASFSIDLGQIGSVNPSTGVVTPSGKIGGVANVTASFNGQSVTTPLNVIVSLTENGGPAVVADAGADASPDASNAGGNGGVGGSPAGPAVTDQTMTLLEEAATPDATLSWLYPYDKTVWPQGVLAPLLQWSTGTTYDAVYVQLQETGFTYQGFFATPSAGQPFVNVPLQQKAWDTLVYSNQGEPVTVTLTFSSNGVAYGPITETWTIAQGTLTGTVYYNSYGTSLAINFQNTTAGYPNFGGATLAIKHGATSPVLIAGAGGIAPNSSNCRVCHSVSANGSTLLTEHGDNYNETSMYALTMGNTETVLTPSDGTFSFPAPYPDGTLIFNNSLPFPGTNPLGTGGLWSVATGTSIASTGLPANFAAGSPSFSPDGKHLAFNQWSGDQASLGSLDFDGSTNTFSNLLNLHTPDSGTIDLFPAYLPTNNALVFERELSSPGGHGVTRDGNTGELWWVDVATQTATALTTLNGTGYLPNTGTNHSADDTYNYEPTVNPVPSGGYAWVVFTSRRAYGNVATQDPFLSDPRNYNASLSATTKKLWVAAIDLNAPPGTDPSHPAFYLPAQELFAGNSRGYWVVDPCEASGTSCLTGDQCCSGYCGVVDGGESVCGTQPPGCAVLGNKCAATSDCCGDTSGISCIDGFCAEPGKKVDAGACKPTTCAKLGYNCGPAGDGCGNLLDCGTCTSPDTCGGAGASGVCGSSSGPH